jgi:hypothetical protein
MSGVAPRTTNRPWLARVASSVLLAFALVTTACGGSDKKGGPTDNGDGITGRYNVSSVSVNGVEDNSAPFFLFEAQDPDGNTIRYEILDGYVDLQSGGRYTTQTTYRVTTNGQVQQGPDGDQGTYAVTGNTITLTSNNGEVTEVTKSGSSLSTTQGIDLNEDGTADLQLTMVATK